MIDQASYLNGTQHWSPDTRSDMQPSDVKSETPPFNPVSFNNNEKQINNPSPENTQEDAQWTDSTRPIKSRLSEHRDSSAIPSISRYVLYGKYECYQFNYLRLNVSMVEESLPHESIHLPLPPSRRARRIHLRLSNLKILHVCRHSRAKRRPRLILMALSRKTMSMQTENLAARSHNMSIDWISSSGQSPPFRRICQLNNTRASV